MREDLDNENDGKNKDGKRTIPFLFMRFIHGSHIWAVTDPDVAGFEWPVFFVTCFYFAFEDVEAFLKLARCSSCSSNPVGGWPLFEICHFCWLKYTMLKNRTLRRYDLFILLTKLASDFPILEWLCAYVQMRPTRTNLPHCFMIFAATKPYFLGCPECAA